MEKWKIDNKIIVFTLLSFTELLLLRSKDAKPTEECFFNKTVLLGFRTYVVEKNINAVWKKHFRERKKF
jgi:hypothetical protein